MHEDQAFRLFPIMIIQHIFHNTSIYRDLIISLQMRHHRHIFCLLFLHFAHIRYIFSSLFYREIQQYHIQVVIIFVLGFTHRRLTKKKQQTPKEEIASEKKRKIIIKRWKLHFQPFILNVLINLCFHSQYCTYLTLLRFCFERTVSMNVIKQKYFVFRAVFRNGVVFTNFFL